MNKLRLNISHHRNKFVTTSDALRFGSLTLLLLACFSVFVAGATLLGNGGQQSTQNQPKIFSQEIPNTTIKFELVYVPDGEFEFADPTKGGQRRKVKVKGFWIGRTEVTWDEYDVFLYKLDLTEDEEEETDAYSRPSRPYGAPDRGWGHHGYPVIGITYHAAEQYCKWLSHKTGLKFRLPTEIEWEYACRANTWDAAPFKDKTLLDKFAWFAGNSNDKTQPVGKRQPNPWGIYDMLGNVAEWCTGVDGKPVVRGGSFKDPAEKVHPGARELPSPDWQASDPQVPKSKWWLTDAPFVGFRVLCENIEQKK
ncbi:MAG: formylglycine-generating enzyme family protein [Armatimonadota bacterium]